MTNVFSGAGGTSHTYGLLGLTNGTSYTRHVRCQDAAGNPMTSSVSVSFSVASGSVANDPVVNTTCPTGTTIPSSTGAVNSVILCAAVNESTPSITLNWSPVTGRTVNSIVVSRKSGYTSTSWTQVATPAVSATSWTDTSVTIGQYYEYKVTINGSANGYISAGIKVPQETYRGKIVLVVDNTFQTSLATSIQNLINDLNADKWVVAPIYVSRTATPASVRNSIKAVYDADPTNTKAVYLLGHVPVASLGNVNPDGHVGRRMSSDSIYGEMTSNWTSLASGCTPAPTSPVGQDTGLNNLEAPSNDAIFCYSNPPSALELQVGRVDMFRVTAFGGTEDSLLSNYLAKVSQYKKKQFTPIERALIKDYFGGSNGKTLGSTYFATLGGIVGANNLTINNAGSPNLSSLLNNQSYLWTYGNYYGLNTQGSVAYSNVPVLGNTTIASTTPWGSVFTILWGSYFGEWNDQNAYLKSLLASGQSMATVYGGPRMWYFHSTGMGKNIGFGALSSINNSSLYTPAADDGGYGTSLNSSSYMTLLGDPTLRGGYVGQPSGLLVSNSGGVASFSWVASTDSPLGYNIYEIQSNNIRKVNSSIIGGTSFTSTDTYDANKKYMVTAVKVKSSFGGTYYNESLGVISSETIVSHVWGMESEITPETVRSHVKSLRKKIDSVSYPSIITTVHGMGYTIENQ
jgi:hypothetical protein